MPSAMPRNSESDPSVTISGGSSSRAMSTAFSAPPAAPTSKREQHGRSGSASCQSREAAPKTTADEPHHRADREIDAAGDDDRRQRDGQQAELDAEPQDFEEVGER